MTFEAEAPRRLHPLTVLVEAGQGMRSFAIPILIAFVVSARDNASWGSLALLGGAMLSLILPWLRWRAFTYRIDATALTIEKGITNRSRSTIPLDRIQDVSIEQGAVERVLGMAKVKIETGGGVADEGLLASVGLSEARRLRALLQGAAVAPTLEDDDVEAPLFAMSFRRVLLVGLFNFSLLWLAALVWLAQKADDLLGLDWHRLASIAEHEAIALWSFQAVLGLVVLVLALTVLAGTARAIVRYTGFHLTHRDGRFRLRQGLFARSDVVILDRRIQLTLIRTGLIRRWFGWQSLQFQTLGGSEGPLGRLEVAPLARIDETNRILDTARLPRFQSEGLNEVSDMHGVATAVRRGVPVLVGFGIGGFFYPWAWLGLLLLFPVFIVSALAARHHRYALHDGELQVSRGVLKSNAWIIPCASVQVVRLRQGPLQRMLGTTTVSADSAGASGQRPNLVDLPVGLAASIGAELIPRART